MPAKDAPNETTPRGLRIRRFLWDGVLPEALGLCFVVIIFGGFAAAYFAGDAAWKNHAATAHQDKADRLARTLAAAVGAAAELDHEQRENLLRKLCRESPVSTLHWSGADGSPRWQWPPVSTGAPGISPAGSGSAPSGDGAALPVAEAAVSTYAGQPAGKLTIQANIPRDSSYRATLAGGWGLAAGATLLVFAGVYWRLRRHLRPLAAIQRNLHSYADGLEKELLTLTLSDALGTAAQGWNRLIGQLSEMARQLESVRHAGPAQDVLGRFESAVFRRLVDNLPLGVVCVGEQERVTYANPAGAALLRREPDELGGLSLEECLTDENVVRAVRATRAGRGGGHSIDCARGEDGERTDLRFRMVPLSKQSSGGDVLVAIEDIGHLRDGEKARDNFLYHVTHELRTPLTNIHAYTETLTKPGFDDEQTRKECYNVIISETRRLSGLVENILSISQLEVGTARLDVGEVDFQRLLRQMVQDNLGAADEKQIDLTLALPPKVPKIRGDKQRLSVLLNNLIGNAIKYTPSDGKVHVKLELHAEWLQISVSDTGIGIAAEDQAHVFDKFYRAADDAVQTVTGTGLGLAIAREVARLHGGDIRLESTPGQGSTFMIELPRPVTDQAEVPAS